VPRTRFTPAGRTHLMRVVLQRVARAEVRVADRVVGRIDRGLVVLAGFQRDDAPESLAWMADRILSLRVFPDAAGDHAVRADDPSVSERADDASISDSKRPSAFSRDIMEADGRLLVVSQFTLYGDTRKGRRPSFSAAATPDVAVPLYDRFVELLRERVPGRVETGEFGAMMDVELVNDGPVTLILER
jgi:D-tyrosyl-tRNA(Tyr) deacylase